MARASRWAAPWGRAVRRSWPPSPTPCSALDGWDTLNGRAQARKADAPRYEDLLETAGASAVLMGCRSRSVLARGNCSRSQPRNSA